MLLDIRSETSMIRVDRLSGLCDMSQSEMLLCHLFAKTIDERVLLVNAPSGNVDRYPRRLLSSADDRDFPAV